ncbi:PAS domain-containing sensor histidine kinase [Winogradskyella thalassocola]|uniref:histidine kinase n=1 Tax=Winogradskyella thalassocola TaxID=262004 RepID=A0A1G7Y556_9FLAO|nr:PAS domain-containing sensor histidine kinase [Winogradskyella thalassocola]SDG91493.1 PAS domain S-box-containing protein [Winogradskyella thalassocola]
MSQDQIDILKRALEREKKARKAAEKILEEKSRELYFTSQKLENLLDEKSSQLEGVFENIVDAYVVMDIQGDIIKFNEAATRLFGYDIGRDNVNVKDLVFKDDYEYAMTSFMQLHTQGFFKDYEARIYTKSKEVKWVHINASVVYDKDKKPIAAQGIVRDITAERASEEKLIESENRLATLVLNLDSGIVLEDENRNIVLTNKKFCELFNIDAEPSDLFGMDCTDASEQNKLLLKNPEAFIQRMDEIDSAKKVVIGDELEMVDGKILERNYMPITIGEKSKGFLWTFTDVTLKRTYRKSLEVQKQKYYSIIANMHLGLVEVNNHDEILLINHSFSEMSGYSEEELLGKKAGEIFPIEGGSEIIAIENEKRKKGESNSYEIKIETKQGEVRYWLISGAPNYDINGHVVGSIGVHLDITNLKALELQKEKLLLKLEKSNDELQEYAHIVSHDLKSPLRSIDALVSWLKEDNKGKLDAMSMRNFELIEATLEKMEQLISDVLDYSSVGTDTTVKADVDLNKMLQDLTTILYIPDHIKITALQQLPIIKGDGTKLQQLFQNLISNAVKFIDKEKGSITIDFEDLKSHYKFSIQDNGIGIEKQFHDKIFKIFHALNKSKDSTGIGLSIVKKIVDLHEGQIWLESQLNIGTTFYFTLKKQS